jgi:hypothetical protein
MGAAADQASVVGSKIVVSGIPTYAATCPPSTRILPSGSAVWPAQKRFAGVYGTDAKEFVAGFQTSPGGLSEWSSHVKTLPVGKSVIWIATMGQVKGLAHCPIWEGSVGLIFDTVTVTGLEVV